MLNPLRLVLIRVALLLSRFDLGWTYGGSSRTFVGLALIRVDSCVLELT